MVITKTKKDIRNFQNKNVNINEGT